VIKERPWLGFAVRSVLVPVSVIAGIVVGTGPGEKAAIIVMVTLIVACLLSAAGSRNKTDHAGTGKKG
jgi:hypothetical protein